VPLCKFPKILGVTWHVMFCFHKHVADIVAKSWQRLNLMKAVCGSSWGHDKETLLLTFRAFFESVFSFASPIWFPSCKPSNIQKLQVIQNAAMRLITGCHRASPINHLYCGTKLMPVAPVNALLTVFGQLLSPKSPFSRCSPPASWTMQKQTWTSPQRDSLFQVLGQCRLTPQ
jgi:hypothetical protein